MNSLFARGANHALCPLAAWAICLALAACTAVEVQSNTGSTATAVAASTAVGAPCGYKNTGKLLHVGENLDVCVPATVCTAEVCPADLGTCVEGQCVLRPGYKGLQTLPQGWATYYCQLSTGGCNGVTQVEPPMVSAQKLGKQLGLPLCEGARPGVDCVGIAASSPMMIGNSQNATDARNGMPVRPWGLGLSEAANICYKISGSGGTAYVPLTDRCGGYCKCNGMGYQECGTCVNANTMTPNCPCVGTLPGVADTCCGAGCPVPKLACDWCASNNHPHFDLDQDTFNHVCGDQKTQGSCQLKEVVAIACPLGVSWPPP